MDNPALDLGPYEGDVAPELRSESFLATLRGLPDHLPRDTGPQESFRRSAVLRVELAGRPVAVKVFQRQSPARSSIARTRGSKAKKSWIVARALEERGVGTAQPFGYLERWEGDVLAESYFLTEWLDDISSFNRQLLHLIHHEFQYDKILDLMNVVAAQVRKMHDAGIVHGDMGNQNIVLRRTGDSSWGDVGFIDLNRGRVQDSLSLKERAFDCSRVTLPSRLLKNFLSMYWRDRYHAGKRPPREFMRHLKRYRRRFAFHSATRSLRHPIRSRKKRREDPKKPRYPAPRDYWIWDERTDQAIGMLMRKDKLRHTPVWPMLKSGLRSATAFLPSLARFKKLRKECFQRPLSLWGGIGMTLTPTRESVENELKYLGMLEAKLPVLLRFYHHDNEDEWQFAADLAKRLHEDGHPVAGAFIQSRKAVTDPESWRAFLRFVFERVGHFLVEAELAHAINRVKWGLWSPDEYARLLRPWVEVHKEHPQVRLLGPSVNDFEFQYVVAALGEIPKSLHVDALSLHLYVDRRGAPENKQKLLGGAYSALDKFAWARALAQRSPRCNDAVVISEVNWPLKDPGHYAHEFAPYFWKGNPSLDTTVTEEEYGWFMLRYYLLALASGMVQRVYWWHLASPMFGLVDTTVDGWRARPAHAMLKTLLRHAEGATFTERVEADDDDTYMLRFKKRDQSQFAIAWTNGKERDLPADAVRYEDAIGQPLDKPKLSGAPIYLFES
ncbi:MAG: lipopolysaccharide kinase InaA family protein [Planctomycetota bacterium]